ncbi:hypothetical protein GOODEAATRI_000536 [Goodea atripinnis]|uniref:adenylate cyclase n=1 Tax=Goodea atripinnis TaxID=208336 RepID=A0ABV0PU70_9TELE
MTDNHTTLKNGDCESARQTSDITFSANISPAHGLRRKRLLWQTAVRNIIDQHNLYSLRLAGGLERGRHRIIVTDAYIADINRYDVISRSADLELTYQQFSSAQRRTSLVVTNLIDIFIRLFISLVTWPTGWGGVACDWLTGLSVILWAGICGLSVTKKEVFSKALLYLAMNTAGIFINYLSDRTQRQSFLETRRCIEGRVRLERENQRQEHQCLRIKILGDCYYCVSGVPEPQRGHARCCVEMGLSMISTIRVSNTHLALTRTAKTTIEPDLFMFPLGGKEMSSSLRQVHISQATLDCLGGIYETEQGHGQERNEFLRKHNINTYLIRPATWEEAQPPKARRPSYDELTTWSAELPFGDILGMNFLPNHIAAQRSGSREVNKRIRQAMEVRSSELMRKEHITTFTQVFKDSQMEGKIRDELFKSNMVCSFILLILLMAVQVLIPAPRWCPMVAQFIISGCVYFLLMLLTLGEEFKHCPAPLQSLCCWVHETKYARTVLMLTAITVNSVIASVNVMVRHEHLYSSRGERSFILHSQKITLRLSCMLQLAFLLLTAGFYTYVIEIHSELVLFALAMEETLRQINTQTGNQFQLRVGVAHGPVIAGVIGATKPQYDIWGATVNMASRMESTGVDGRIQVPESTSCILLERGFLRQLRGDIYVKGISERHGKVRTFLVSNRDERSSFVERGAGRGFSMNRNTLGAVVYSLVQARKREKLREQNGGFHLVEAS